MNVASKYTTFIACKFLDPMSAFSRVDSGKSLDCQSTAEVSVPFKGSLLLQNEVNCPIMSLLDLSGLYLRPLVSVSAIAFA